MKAISVLVVEDEPTVATALQMRLKRSFSKIMIAPNGRSGLKVALEEKPDIIITDLRMPFMEGLDMVAEIRKTLKDVPVIVLTASLDRLDEARAEELGVVGYFTKPLMVNALVEKIQELVYL